MRYCMKCRYAFNSALPDDRITQLMTCDICLTSSYCAFTDASAEYVKRVIDGNGTFKAPEIAPRNQRFRDLDI